MYGAAIFGKTYETTLNPSIVLQNKAVHGITFSHEYSDHTVQVM